MATRRCRCGSGHAAAPHPPAPARGACACAAHELLLPHTAHAAACIAMQAPTIPVKRPRGRHQVQGRHGVEEQVCKHREVGEPPHNGHRAGGELCGGGRQGAEGGVKARGGGARWDGRNGGRGGRAAACRGARRRGAGAVPRPTHHGAARCRAGPAGWALGSAHPSRAGCSAGCLQGWRQWRRGIGGGPRRLHQAAAAAAAPTRQVSAACPPWDPLEPHPWAPHSQAAHRRDSGLP